jgi:general secretion pathway protein A
LVQLKQRVALRCTLGLLDLMETSAYVTGRLRIAGANGREIFTREALGAIYQRSGGVPRTISVICDNAMVSGFASGVTSIGLDLIREVCNDFDLNRPYAPAPETSRPAGPKTDISATPPVPVEVATPKVAADDPADRLFASYGKRRGFSFF